MTAVDTGKKASVSHLPQATAQGVLQILSDRDGQRIFFWGGGGGVGLKFFISGFLQDYIFFLELD